jgi:hypothetical protein
MTENGIDRPCSWKASEVICYFAHVDWTDKSGAGGTRDEVSVNSERDVEQRKMTLKAEAGLARLHTLGLKHGGSGRRRKKFD